MQYMYMYNYVHAYTMMNTFIYTVGMHKMWQLTLKLLIHTNFLDLFCLGITMYPWKQHYCCAHACTAIDVYTSIHYTGMKLYDGLP